MREPNAIAAILASGVVTDAQPVFVGPEGH